MKLGLVLPASVPTADGPQRLNFERVVAIAQQADAHGFESLWWFDHYFIEQDPGRRSGSYECWTLLSAVAMRTQRVRLGSLVLCNTFRHAAILAKQAASLQEISGGRLILGLGAGWHEPEYRALGLPFDHRVGRLEESVRVIRELFDTGISSFSGRWLQLSEAELFPKPAPKPPLWIAGAGERMLNLTAEYADGWNLAWFGSDAGRFLRKLEEFRAGLRRAGREGAVETSVGLNVAPLASAAEESEALKRLRAGNQQLAQVSDEDLKRRYIIGDPQMMAQQLRPYREAGVDLAICLVPGLSDRGAGAELLQNLAHVATLLSRD